jgi:NAD(P)-dependent dehydrogenase (short-subunit alcohol dehydrogenase family)
MEFPITKRLYPRMSKSKQNPRAMVTGGSAGIGRALASALVSDGYRVAISGRDGKRLAEAEKATGAALSCVCDVRDPAAVEAAFSLLEKEFGGLDLLVNNAGVGRFLSLEETEEADWESMIGTNLTGSWRVTRRALPLLLESKGTVLNVISVAGRKAFPGSSAYCASKFGMLGLAESLREEFRGRGLRVINLLPGATDTPFWEGIEGEWDRSAMLRPETVADAAMGALKLPDEALAEEIVIAPARGSL